MIDKKEEVKNQFQAFLKQKSAKTSMAMKEAQRLVNLYRILNELDVDFLDDYNLMLQNATNEAKMSLNALVGGKEVQQYLEFLIERNRGPETEDNQSRQQSGWLPSPDQDDGVNETTEERNQGVSEAQWKNFVDEQDKKWAKIIADLKDEHKQELTRLMNQLSVSLQSKSPPAPQVAPPKQTNSEDFYSEIIEEK